MWPFVLIFFFGAASGYGQHALDKAQDEASTSLQDALGAKSARVKIEPNGPGAAFGNIETISVTATGFSTDKMPLRMDSTSRDTGRIGTLQVVLDDFSLRSLKVKHLEESIPACRFDFGRAKSEGNLIFARSGVGEGTFEVTQDSLGAFILHKYKMVKSCNVEVSRDVVVVTGKVGIMGGLSDFMLVSRLAGKGTRIDLDGARLFFGLRKASPSETLSFCKLLDPVVDLAGDLGLGDSVDLERVTLRDGVAKAYGKVKIASAGQASASTKRT